MPNFTKTAIKQSFIKLLNEKPMKQISVRDIVEDCGINRNSFYYHFADIPTLLEEIIMDEAEQIISEYPELDSMEECLMATTRFARENKRAIMHIYNSVNRELYEQYLWKMCNAFITTYLNTMMKGKQIDENDLRVVHLYYKCLIFGMTTEWLRTGMHSDIQQDIHRLCELKAGMVEEVIARCKPKSN